MSVVSIRLGLYRFFKIVMVGKDSLVKTFRLCDLQRWEGASRNIDVEFLVVLMGQTMW
jgi:hypothetical protein